jgi:hypothetical protein
LALQGEIGVLGRAGFCSIRRQFFERVSLFYEEVSVAAGTDVEVYLSPLKKLMRFFRKSRDGWKRKCQDAKHTLKLLKNQVRAVQRSREQWKLRCQEQERRIAELEAELQKTSAA